MTLTTQQRDILARFAMGRSVPDIAFALGIKEREVQAVIAVSGGDRAEAQRILGRPTPPAPPASLEDLLDAGQRHEKASVRKLADRARTLIDALHDVLEHDEKDRAARQEVARLEAELADARAKLGPAAKPKPAGQNTDMAKARAWAIAPATAEEAS